MIEGLDIRHEEYDLAQYERRAVRDAMKGMPAVKRAGELYLPMPAGFVVDSTAPNSAIQTNASSRLRFDTTMAPWYHQNPAYMSYIQRARYPELVGHTYRGLMGTVGRKEPNVKVPSKMEFLKKKATMDGKSLFEFFLCCVGEVFQTGNVDIIVGIDENENLPYLKYYPTEQRINWLVQGDELQGINYSFKIAKNAAASFSTEPVEANLIFWMDDGVVKKMYFEEQQLIAENAEDLTPSLQGRSTEKLPIVTIGSLENVPCPQPSLLSAISEVALAIYRKDADLCQAQHMTCNPNMVITGVSGQESAVPNIVGSTVALAISNPDAKVYYPETDTSALDHVAGTITSLFEESLMLGASLIGPSKKAAESEATVKTRQMDKSATIVTVVENVGKGIETALKICAEYLNVDREGIEFVPNKDFADNKISPQMLVALRDLWLASGMSRESLIGIVKKSGLLPPEVDVEDELKRIEHEGPISGADPDANNGDQYAGDSRGRKIRKHIDGANERGEG